MLSRIGRVFAFVLLFGIGTSNASEAVLSDDRVTTESASSDSFLQSSGLTAQAEEALIDRIFRSGDRPLTSFELTTGSILRVGENKYGRWSLVAVNARVRNILARLIETSGQRIRLPANVNGRLTVLLEAPLNDNVSLETLDHIALINGLFINRNTAGPEVELQPREPEWYNLTDEQRLEASVTKVNPTTPTLPNPITTGFLIYEGHYVAPPYEITKVRSGEWKWEIRINGLTWMSRPIPKPAGWVPVPDKNGQIHSLEDTILYCKILWRRCEAKGYSVEASHANISEFLKGLDILDKHEWLGNYGLHLVCKNGYWDSILVKEITYPPDEQFSHGLEISACVQDLRRKLKEQGKITGFNQVKPFVVQWLMGQEIAAGPKHLGPGQRIKNAINYYDENLMPWVEMEPLGQAAPKLAAADVENQIDRSTSDVTRRFRKGGLVFLTQNYRGECSFRRLQELIQIVESDAPPDVKACAIRRTMRWDIMERVVWSILANFRPTAELKERLAAAVANQSE